MKSGAGWGWGPRLGVWNSCLKRGVRVCILKMLRRKDGLPLKRRGKPALMKQVLRRGKRTLMKQSLRRGNRALMKQAPRRGKPALTKQVLRGKLVLTKQALVRSVASVVDVLVLRWTSGLLQSHYCC